MLQILPPVAICVLFWLIIYIFLHKNVQAKNLLVVLITLFPSKHEALGTPVKGEKKGWKFESEELLLAWNWQSLRQAVRCPQAKDEFGGARRPEKNNLVNGPWPHSLLAGSSPGMRPWPQQWGGYNSAISADCLLPSSCQLLLKGDGNRALLHLSPLTPGVVHTPIHLQGICPPWFSWAFFSENKS